MPIAIADSRDKKELIDHIKHLLILWLWRHIVPTQREAILAYLELMKLQPKTMEHECRFETIPETVGFRLTITTSFRK